MNRRNFLSTCAAAAAASAFPYHLYAAEKAKLATDRVKLGPKQVELSRLAMGTGSTGWNKSSNQTRKLGIKGLADLLVAGVDNGVTFWDTADQYGSHPHLAEGLKTVKREKVTIMTKTRAKTADEMKADLDRFRKELNTDYIDILLLHCLTDKEWNTKMRGVMDVISEAQEKGIIKTKGCSCHSLDALKTAAAEPWVEVDLARLNPKQAAMDADPATVIGVLKEMKAKGKGVIGMKVYGDGKLAEQRDQMLQYILAQDVIDCFTIGMESHDHLTDNIKRIKESSVRA